MIHSSVLTMNMVSQTSTDKSLSILSFAYSIAYSIVSILYILLFKSIVNVRSIT